MNPNDIFLNRKQPSNLLLGITGFLLIVVSGFVFFGIDGRLTSTTVAPPAVNTPVGWPVDGIISRCLHQFQVGSLVGIDIASGGVVKDLYANMDGVVNLLGDPNNPNATACGLGLDIYNSSSGVTIHHCHLSQYLVADGATVTAGTKVGRTGSSGSATGVHDHYALSNTSFFPANCTIGATVTHQTFEPPDTTLPTVSQSHSPSFPVSGEAVTFSGTARDTGSGLQRIRIHIRRFAPGNTPNANFSNADGEANPACEYSGTTFQRICTDTRGAPPDLTWVPGTTIAYIVAARDMADNVNWVPDWETFVVQDPNGGGGGQPAQPPVDTDSDEDGFLDSVEIYVGTDPNDNCGSSGGNPSYAWPADLYTNSPSTNKIDIQDIVSFLVPIRRLGTVPGDDYWLDGIRHQYDVRWDIDPKSIAGPLIAGIDILDLIKVITVIPPMFDGVRAFGGPICTP